MNLLRANCFSQISKGFLASIFSTLLFSPAAAQDAKQNLGMNANQAPKIVETQFHYSGASFKPSSRRDPFLNPLLYKKNAKQNVDEEESRGTPPPGIGGTLITQAALQGISIRDTGKVAVVRGADARAYFLREGDRLFDGYLKSIENDSITLVRETRMKSGKILTQDVIKRLRTP
jgi:hypothetical protein